MLQMPLVVHVWAMELRVAGVIQLMLRRQAAVRSGGGFLRRKLSALDDQPWSNMNSAKSQLAWSQRHTRS